MQGIEVVLIESALAAVVEAIIGCCLAKVALNGRHSLLHETFYLRLIPVDGLGIREVEYGILHRHTARSIHHMHASLDNLREETILGCEVRQLPQAGMESIL